MHMAPSPPKRPLFCSSSSFQGAGPVSLEAEVPVSPWQCPASSCRDEDLGRAIVAATLTTEWLKMAWPWHVCLPGGLTASVGATSPVALCVSCTVLVLVIIFLPAVAARGNKDAGCPVLK